MNLELLTPYLLPALALIFVLVALTFRSRLNGLARTAVSAVYRVAIHSAHALQDEGVAWLRSDAGIAYRRHLAELAYDELPANIGPMPVGVVKLIVSREQWCSLVEAAFLEAVNMADKLELPDELPTA